MQAVIEAGKIRGEKQTLAWAVTGFALRPAYLLAVILALALLHGLLYILVVPPWQHADEPKHFEYAWLAAHLPRWPRSGDSSAELSRAVNQSLVDNHFYGQADVSASPPGSAIEGYSQLEEPPLYYFLASRVLMVFKSARIEVQLLLARGVSLAFFLLAVLSAWGVAREVAPKAKMLHWLLPLFLALLPGFVDAMSAANNDSAAVGLASLALWGEARLLHKRSLPNLAWVLLAASLSFLAKNTAYFVIPLGVIAILISLASQRRRWIAWLAAAVILAAGVLVALSWGYAGSWYARSGTTPSRLAAPAPLGVHVFHVRVPPGKTAKGLQQLLPPGISRGLHGKVLTLGAWMWASQPVEGYLAQFQWFNGVSSIYSARVAIGVQPEFHAFAFTFRELADRAWITLGEGVAAGGEPVDLYFDGVVLLEGEWSDDQPPVFAMVKGDSGTWQGEQFTNLARNGSAESAWPFFRQQVEAAAARLFSDPSADNMTVAMYTALDRAASWYYSASARSLLQTFWGKFGWAHVPLVGHKPYRVLGVLTLAGIAGALLALWKQRRKINWNVLALLGLATLAVWGLALVRGTNYLLIPIRVYLPVARYVFPAVIPAALVLCLGWLEPLTLLGDRFRVPAAVRGSVLLLGLASLDVYALVSLFRFYAAFYR